MRARLLLSAIVVVLASSVLTFAADATAFSAFSVQPQDLVNGSVCLLSVHVAGNPQHGFREVDGSRVDVFSWPARHLAMR